MDVVDQRIEFRQRAKNRIDIGIIAYIVTEVGHGRRIDRRDPDRVYAEPLEIIELLPNATQITDAVTVTVHERTRVNLINNTALPPAKIFQTDVFVNCNFVGHFNHSSSPFSAVTQERTFTYREI